MTDTDLLIRELIHKGYHVTGPFHAPHHDESRPKLSVTKSGKPFIVKYSSVSPNSIDAETSYAREELAGIPGIVSVVDHGSARKNGIFLTYNIKPHLPGPRLCDVSLTRELGGMVLDTQQRMHERGVLLEPETRLDDFVLDENGRPTLVDMEYLQMLDAPSTFSITRVGDHMYERSDISFFQRRKNWLDQQNDRINLLHNLTEGKNGKMFRPDLWRSIAAYKTVQHGPAVAVGVVLVGAVVWYTLNQAYKFG